MAGIYFHLVKDSKRKNHDKELIVLKLPYKPKYRKSLIQCNKRVKNIIITNNNNNNDILKYVSELRTATIKCLNILKSLDILNHHSNNNNNNNNNIYCPFHEHKNTSKSPSAVFHNNNNLFICYSTNCPLRKIYASSTSDIKINSITLLKELNKII